MWTKQQKLYQLNLLEKIDFWHVHPKIIVFSPASWMCIVGMSIWSKHSSKFMSQTTLVCLHHVQFNTFSSLKTKTCSFSLKTFRTIFWNENRLCVGKKNIALIIICQGNRSQVFFQQLVSTILPNLQCPYPSISSFFFWSFVQFCFHQKTNQAECILNPLEVFHDFAPEKWPKPKNSERRSSRLHLAFPSTITYSGVSKLAVKKLP